MTPEDLKEWLEPRLDRLADDIAAMKVTSASQAKDISWHIARTDLLEERVEQVAESIKPVEAHVQQLRGGWMLVVGLGVVVGLMAGILRLVNP
jgi:hypothetical protein